MGVRFLEGRSLGCMLIVKSSKLARAVFLLCSLLLSTATSVSALDPHKLMPQYGHTAWRNEDGILDRPTLITQTSDGYVWVCTATALMRFDGVKFTPWIVPRGESLPRGVTYLLGARDGNLWIGASHGLSRLKENHLVDYTSQLGGAGINEMLEDHTGAVWFTRYRISDGKGPLCRVTGEGIRCYGENDGIPVKYGLGLAEDTAGNIWLGSNMLCRWAPGSSSFYFEEEMKHTGGNGVAEVAAGPSGSIWAALDAIGPNLGVRYFSGGTWASYVVPGFNSSTVLADALVMDHNHSLWIGTESQGLYRIHDGVAGHYGVTDGLSGNSVQCIYEDKGGNLWVVTNKGIDLFRDTPVVTFSADTGIIGTGIQGVLALSNGSVWVTTNGALNVIDQAGQVSRLPVGDGRPGEDLQTVFEDHAGRIWLGVADSIMIYEHGHFIDVKKSDGSASGHVGVARAFTEDVDGNVWAVLYKKGQQQRHLLRIKNRCIEQDIAMSNLPFAEYLTADRHAGIWIGSLSHKMAHYGAGPMEIVSLGSGDDTFTTHSLFVDAENAVWASTSKGLYHWMDGHLNVMDSRNGLPCSVIYSAISDNYGSLWLYTRCGLMRIQASDMAGWLKSPDSKVPVKLFDRFDGAQAGPGSMSQPRVSKSPDGRLWFANDAMVQVVDPSRSYTDVIPPPVHVEYLEADHKTYDIHSQLRLPPLQGELEINYTALSFTVPQKVRFRYMLDGHDTEWQDPGTRRQAFYNDLGPGTYRFQVVACNKDGIWNNKGASLAFSILPAWYQTVWFRLACIVAFGLLLSALHELRRRQIQYGFNMSLEARVDERTRIARELHDTLLQSFQGLLICFQRASNLLPSRPQEAKQRLELAIDQASNALTEGRDAVHELRSGGLMTIDLAQAISNLGKELLSAPMSGNSPEFRADVVGTPRNLNPPVRDEAYRLAAETLRNAIRHASARRIEMEIRYDDQHLRLRIRDDGKGIDPTVLDNDHAMGHWGLRGMRERAKVVGGTLEVWSELGSGTEVELTIPAESAYAKPLASRWSAFSRVGWS
jgi:signal transduction histidine kinase/ligand-binding sensor domain-containing protein